MKLPRSKVWKRFISAVLCSVIILGIIFGYGKNISFAGENRLGIGQAKALALANSTDYRLAQSKIALKEVSYKQAVKALELKRKNKTTFRWSPLLDFKFPEKLNLEEESEAVYKPMQLQNEIKELKHKLADTKHAVYEKVSNLFVSIYAYQEVIAFQEEQLEALEENLEKNQVRLALGLANQKDVDSITSSINKIRASLSENMRKFEREKEKLSSLMELDVTTQYYFSNPYLESDIPRSELEDLVEYTLANDQSYYEAKMDTQLALTALETNYSLMESQYGNKMSYISSYIRQAKSGDKIDSSAFKLSYDAFLKAIDEPWQGSYRILFVKFPKEWFKGEIDGVRYVEDEPYILYENALEYQDALAEQKALAKDLENQVREYFENQISARNSYENILKEIEMSKAELDKKKVMNALGTCTFEEYTDVQTEYEQLLLDSMDALEAYTSLLYSYDRLTCGGVSKYLSGLGINIGGASGAESYIVKEEDAQEGARYYIRSLIEDSVFEVGIYIPEGFETEITDYELWCDGIQIGERTAINATIRHLALAKGMVDNAYIRLYRDDTFVGDCEIDPQSYEGPLSIPGEYVIVKEENTTEIGTYETVLNPETSLVEITMKFKPEEEIVYYTLQDEAGNYIFEVNLTDVKVPFRYLSVLASGLEKVIVNCYDKNQNLMYQGYFDTETYKIYKKNE